MGSSNRTIVAMLVVVALAAAFWLLLLGPKRQKADDLSGQVEQLRSSLIQAESQAADAARARRKFPADYHQLVTLGKAVPGERRHGVAAGPAQPDRARLQRQVREHHAPNPTPQRPRSTTAPTRPRPAPPRDTAPSPTAVRLGHRPRPRSPPRCCRSGATVGSAGLAVMPYNLTFSGNFFNVADFIQGVDSLVHTGHSNVRATGGW